MRVAFALSLSADNMYLRPMLNELEVCIAPDFRDRKYGVGVKEVVILISAVADELRLAEPRLPIYHQGKQEIVEDGISFIIEDILEFEVPLNNSSNLVTMVQVAAAVSDGVALASGNIFDLRLAEFDVLGFFGDLHQVLKRCGQGSPP